MAASNTRAERSALHRTMQAIMSESKSAALQSGPPELDKPRGQTLGRYPLRDLPPGIAELVFDIPKRRHLSELVLTTDVVSEVKEFLFEFTQAPLLRANSLEPRHTLLLVGPPGNGKTSLAEMVATELSLPLLCVRYDAIVDSFLGETANRLRKLVDYATLNPCVLFFDEFDAVGKERSDAQETGEIKRVVSSLLMLMDRLPSHAVVVCATNHPELLDRAVWRRFEVKLNIDRPGKAQLVEWFKRFQKSIDGDSVEIKPEEFAKWMAGENMSEVEAFTLDVRRKIVLAAGKLSPAQAIKEVFDRRKKRLISLTQGGNNGDRLSAGSAEKKSANRRTNQERQEGLFSAVDSVSGSSKKAGPGL